MEEQTLVAKTCLNCGENVGPGRKDKKYCSEACKTEYNNKLNEKKRSSQKEAPRELSVPEFVSGINHVLFKNRNILEECLGTKDTCGIKRREIDGRGFRFKFFTSCDRTATGEEYYFCYDLGYKEVENERLVVVRRPREATY